MAFPGRLRVARLWLRGGALWIMAGVVAAASSCSSLPDIERGACGNGIVEPEHNEDCDNGLTDDAGKLTCYPAGTAAACHFDCSSVVCPGGFFCGNDAVCRKPSGIFKDTGHATQVDADRLLVGDFDHDGLGDVVAQTTVQMNVLYGDPSGSLSEPFTLRAPSSNPAVGQLALDGDAGTSEPNTDIVFTATSAVTTWRGRADRTLAPTSYPSLRIGPEESRVIELKTTHVTDDVLIFFPSDTQSAGAAGSFITEVSGDQTPDQNAVFAVFPTNDSLPVNLAGDIPVANFIDGPNSPCDEIALAFGSGGLNTQVTVVTTCIDASTPNTGKLAPPQAPSIVSLPAGATVRKNGVGAHAGDVNGDGHIDLIVDGQFPFPEADGGATNAELTFVAYSLGDGNFSSSLPPVADNKFSVLTTLDANKPVPGPVLAIGQLTASIDKDFDYVLPQGIVFQTSIVPDAGADAGAIVTPLFADQEWGDATIADIDGDGVPDVVAGSLGRVDVYQGRGIPLMNHILFAVDGTASEFAVNDFDGDSAPDIAFRADHGNLTADLDVMWGKRLGAPEDPVVVGRFGNIRNVGSGVIVGSLGNNDAVGDIGVVVQAPDAGAFTVSVLAGDSNRQLQSPFFIQQQRSATTRDIGLPVAYAIGQLTASDRHPDLVSGALVQRSIDGGTTLDMELAIAQSTGAANLSSDPAQLLFTDKFDTFLSFTDTCNGAPCNRPIANWSALSLATADLDGNGDAGTSNGVDEIIGIAPALPTGSAFLDTSASGALFWARLESGAWQIQSLSHRGSLPIDGRTAIAAVTAADVNGDGALDVLVLSDGPRSTTLLAYINGGNGQLPTQSTVIALPSYSTDPDGPFHIVSVAAIDADSDPGKEIALLTDAGGLFLAKSNASGDSFTVTGPLCNGAVPETCADVRGQRIPSGAAIAATDVDGDGIQDLVIESSLTLHVLKGVAVDP